MVDLIMARRRRRAEADEGVGGEVIDTMLEIARHSPAVGLALAAVVFGVGAFLFWGDPKRWMGLGPMAGIPFLLLAMLVAGASVIFYLHGRVTGGGRADAPGSAGISEQSAAHEVTGSAAPPGSSRPRDGLAFERLVAAHFRTQGFAVEETGTHGTGGDRGVDLLLRRPDSPDAATVCVQCKDYAQWKVGAPAVREFASAVRLRGPGHVGWIVTTGRFTGDAVRDAAQLDLRLIDGDSWNAMHRVAGPTPPVAPAAAAAESTVPPAEVPLCPSCRTPMVRRQPKPRGKQFRPFWGCPNYPRCRGSVDIA
jgi:hypothetical protein